MKLLKPIHIYALGSVEHECEHDTLLPLKQLVQEKAGVNPRRIGRFIQMALAGVGDCVFNKAIHPRTAVYLSSENGDAETMVDVLRDMYREQLPPKPLQFINTVSNAACFYIANTFKLSGESSFISTVNASFESALMMACVDLQLQQVPAALVGSVDICTSPLLSHRERIHAPSGCTVGEGSHWLLLATQPPFADAVPLVSLLQCTHVIARDALRAQLMQEAASSLLLGQHLDEQDRKWIQENCARRVCHRLPDSAQPFYNSLGAGELVSFVHNAKLSGMTYINQASHGGYFMLELKKTSEPI